jgi:hypothetical protein
VPSYRARLRAIFDEEFDPESAGQVHIPELVQRVKRRAMAEPEVVDQILHAQIDVLVREYVARRLASQRGLILSGNNVYTPREYEELVVAQASRFETWYENVGSKGNVRLLSMKKADLLEAAAQRTESGVYDLQVAALWRRLAQGLNEEQAVEDVFTTEQIAKLSATLKILVTVEEANGPTFVAEKNGNGKAEPVPPPAPEPPPPPPPAPEPPAPTRPARRAPAAPAQPGRAPRAGKPSQVRVAIPAEPRPRRR